MITRDIYGIGGAVALRGDPRPFAQEVIYTNDPIEMVRHCLECTSQTCNHGECAYTRMGEGRRKRIRKTQPPVSGELINRVTRMWLDGWRKVMIARELGLTAHQVDRTLVWAGKEGLL